TAYERYLVENRSLFTPPRGSGNSQGISRADAEQVAKAQFEKVFETLSLIGSVDRCTAVVDALREIGVDEIACLGVFVGDFRQVRSPLPSLLDLRTRCAADRSVPPAHPPHRAIVPGSLREAPIRADGREFYEYIESIGGSYGPSFRLVRS